MFVSPVALPTFFIGDRPAYVLSGSARERCNVLSGNILPIYSSIVVFLDSARVALHGSLFKLIQGFVTLGFLHSL